MENPETGQLSPALKVSERAGPQLLYSFVTTDLTLTALGGKLTLTHTANRREMTVTDAYHFEPTE